MACDASPKAEPSRGHGPPLVVWPSYRVPPGEAAVAAAPSACRASTSTVRPGEAAVVAAQSQPCKSDSAVTLPPAGVVPMVEAAVGSATMGSPKTATTVRDATLAELTAAKGQGLTRPTIALSQTAETVDEVFLEKPSSSNYQSCRSETYFRLLSAKAEAVVAAVQDSRADATVPAGSMDTFFSSRFTTNRTPSCESFSGCSGWFPWRTGRAKPIGTTPDQMEGA